MFCLFKISSKELESHRRAIKAKSDKYEAVTTLWIRCSCLDSRRADSFRACKTRFWSLAASRACWVRWRLNLSSVTKASLSAPETLASCDSLTVWSSCCVSCSIWQSESKLYPLLKNSLSKNSSPTRIWTLPKDVSSRAGTNKLILAVTPMPWLKCSQKDNSIKWVCKCMFRSHTCEFFLSSSPFKCFTVRFNSSTSAERLCENSVYKMKKKLLVSSLPF